MSAGRAALAENSILEGRYRIDRVVAEGGFGVVYAGHHLTLDLPIAIKVLRLEEAGDPEQSARFLDEARTLSRLRHSHIVRVLDVGVSPPDEDGKVRAWLVMEWCGGRTLRDDLNARPGPRTITEAWSLMRPLIDAVGVAHRHGIVHRDIKPSNIMLVEEESGLSARLIDFGIAKRFDPASSSTLSTGPRAFTPGYAAPEQIAGTRTGPWTDVHALALLLTEMLVGEPPYGADTDAAAIVDPKRPTPKSFSVDVGSWDPVLERALALKTAERYPDANAFLQALEDAAPVSIRVSRTSRPTPLATAPTERAKTTDPSRPSRDTSAPADRTEIATLEAVASEKTRSLPRPSFVGRLAVAVGAVALVALAFTAYRVASSPSSLSPATASASGGRPAESVQSSAASVADRVPPQPSTPIASATASSSPSSATQAATPPTASAVPTTAASTPSPRATIKQPRTLAPSANVAIPPATSRPAPTVPDQPTLH